MNDPGFWVVGRHLVLQPGLDRVPSRRIGGHGALVTLAPAFDLTFHIAFRFAQIAEPAGLVVDVVQFDELVDEALAQGAGLGLVEIQLRRQFRTQDDAVDALHHVELGADHRFIGAVDICLGAVGEPSVELIENAELAAHVMGRLGLVAEWRATQHQVQAGVLQQVGQVRRAAGELGNLRCSVQSRDMCLEVLVDDIGGQFLTRADRGALICKRHCYPFCLCLVPKMIQQSNARGA